MEKAIITVKKDVKIQNQKLEIQPTIKDSKPLVEGEGKLLANPGAGVTIYTLLEPESGEWKLKLTPSGKVRLKNDLLPIRLEISKPQTVHPTGEPIDLAVTFLRSDGLPITPLPQYPISLSAAVKKPDGTIVRPTLKEVPGRRGLYRSEQFLPAATDGRHEITCEVNVGSFLQAGNFTLSKTVLPVEVKPVVYFKPAKPSIASPHNLWNILTFWKRSPIVVEGKLMRSGKELPAKETSTLNRNELVLAQVERDKGQGVTGVEFLKYQETNNTFRGILQPGSKLFPSTHNLFTRSDFPSPNGTNQVREDNNEFEVRYGSGLIAWGIIAYIILYAIGQILLMILRPRLTGQLTVGNIPVPGTLHNSFEFYNKCKVSSKKRKIILPWINSKKYDGDSNSPTFWVIGSGQSAFGRTNPAVLIYYRKFGILPWWTKLKGTNSITLNNKSISWRP